MLRRLIKSVGPLRRTAHRIRSRTGVSGQSDEAAILRRLSDEIGAAKTFVEFGFHPTEFNCASLVADHQGLLIDGSTDQVMDATIMLPSNVQARQRFLTLDNLDIVRDAFPNIGVLSIDVDGNDYWFLERLIDLQPEIISVEYNASFLDQSVTVVYDPAFDRAAKHPSGWYHGASLLALSRLARRYGYGLAAISSGGGNAFFTPNGSLDPAQAWRPNRLRDQWSGTTAQAQFQAVSEMPFVQIDA